MCVRIVISRDPGVTHRGRNVVIYRYYFFFLFVFKNNIIHARIQRKTVFSRYTSYTEKITFTSVLYI